MQQLSKYNVPVSFQAPSTCTGDCKSYSLSLSLASLASFVKEATSFSSKFNFLVRCSHFVLKSLKSIWMWMMQRKFWKPKGPAFVNSNSTAFLLKRYKEISSKVKLQLASRRNFLAPPGALCGIEVWYLVFGFWACMTIILSYMTIMKIVTILKIMTMIMIRTLLLELTWPELITGMKMMTATVMTKKYDIDENQVGESWLQGCTAKPGMKGISSERIQQSQSNIKIIIIISVLSS